MEYIFILSPHFGQKKGNRQAGGLNCDHCREPGPLPRSCLLFAPAAHYAVPFFAHIIVKQGSEVKQKTQKNEILQIINSIQICWAYFCTSLRILSWSLERKKSLESLKFQGFCSFAGHAAQRVVGVLCVRRRTGIHRVGGQTVGAALIPF
ncbi:MAG: hypothetical protein IJK40_02750 [Clostridia bacterium]|nr:hypothetical protein [Clostridia bacterium]